MRLKAPKSQDFAAAYMRLSAIRVGAYSAPRRWSQKTSRSMRACSRPTLACIGGEYGSAECTMTSEALRILIWSKPVAISPSRVVDDGLRQPGIQQPGIQALRRALSVAGNDRGQIKAF